MRFRFSNPFLILVASLSSPIWAQRATPQATAPTSDAVGGVVMKVPSGVILVKGAWSSSSDSETPVPEGGSVTGSVFTDPYFGMTYTLPTDWIEKYQGPPPSDTGRYVLGQFSPAITSKGHARGSILVSAQDLFFTRTPAINAVELINYMKDHLQADYKVERPLQQMKIADRAFLSFGYWSPAAELHWYVFATQIRCHALEIVLTSHDTQLLEDLTVELSKMKLPPEANPVGGTGGGAFPSCIIDYVSDQNLVTRVNPVFTEHRYNQIPVRIIIDKMGKVKHIHFISAFPDQAKAITDALGQWKFKQYIKDGQATEVETGILFGPQSVR
ncbi:MAG TPA: hypothetical protein VKB88_12760 [Bryobacteraceae bacterium]|nr:hypothetical protein [Bryobacteraceae bacterium]